MLALQAIFPMRTFSFLKNTWQKNVEPLLTAAERRRVRQMGGASSSAPAEQLPQVNVNDDATDGCEGAAGEADPVSQQHIELHQTGVLSAQLTSASHHRPHAADPVLRFMQSSAPAACGLHRGLGPCMQCQHCLS